MSMESRVAVLEQGYLAIHAECRGWAGIATAADRKASMSAELLNLTYQDVSAIKSDVVILKTDVATLKADVVILKTDVATLKADVVILKTDVATLKTDVAEHTTILNEHSAKLDEHTVALARIDGTLQEHGRMLVAHGDMLRQILERLPAA